MRSWLYVEHGLRAMSLRAVARCAGVSAPAIYRHFDDKEDLLWAVCLQGHEHFGRYLARGLKGRSPRARLALTAMAYLDFAIDHRAFYMIMFSAPPEHFGSEWLQKQNNDEGTATFQMLVDRVRECVDTGALPEADPVTTSIRIWALVHGLVSLWHRLPKDDSERSHNAPVAVSSEEEFRVLYGSSIEALLDGLGAS